MKPSLTIIVICMVLITAAVASLDMEALREEALAQQEAKRIESYLQWRDANPGIYNTPPVVLAMLGVE